MALYPILVVWDQYCGSQETNVYVTEIVHNSCFFFLLLDSASRQGPMEAVQKSIQLFEEKRYREMRRKNIIGQVCDTPKSYDNVMHVGLRKVTFKWQRGNKIGEYLW